MKRKVARTEIAVENRVGDMCLYYRRVTEDERTAVTAVARRGGDCAMVGGQEAAYQMNYSFQFLAAASCQIVELESAGMRSGSVAYWQC